MTRIAIFSVVLILFFEVSSVHAGGSPSFDEDVLAPSSNTIPRGDWYVSDAFSAEYKGLLDPFLESYTDVSLFPYHSGVETSETASASEETLDLIYSSNTKVQNGNYAKDLTDVYLLYANTLRLSEVILLSIGDEEGIYALPFGVQVVNSWFASDLDQDVANDWELFLEIAKTRAEGNQKTLHIDGKRSLLGLWESVVLGEIGNTDYTSLVHNFLNATEVENSDFVNKFLSANRMFFRILEFSDIGEEGTAPQLPFIYSTDPSYNFSSQMDGDYVRQALPKTSGYALLRMTFLQVNQQSSADDINSEWFRYISSQEQLNKRVEYFRLMQKLYISPQLNNPASMDPVTIFDAGQFNNALHVPSILHGENVIVEHNFEQLLFDVVAMEISEESFLDRIGVFFLQNND